MKTKLLSYILIQSFVLLSLVTFLTPMVRPQILSQYQVGQAWVVSASYLQAKARDDSWSKPILWKYQVERIFSDSEGNQLIEISVKDPQSVRSETVTIAYNASTGNLVSVESTFRMQNTVQRMIQRFSEDDVDAIIDKPVTSAPFFIPSFRRGEHYLFGRKVVSINSTPPIQREVIRAQISQHGFQELDAELAELNDLITVEILENTNRKMLQVWKKNTVWPLYYEAHGCRAFLIGPISGGVR